MSDGIDRIFDTDQASLAATYDEWATSYDRDHDGWGWRGPEVVSEATLRLSAGSPPDAQIYDAGCGTGTAGIALRSAGWLGGISGLDFSKGMLDVAAESGAYQELIKCSLLDIPLQANAAHAVVSSGVFTHGHVGGEAFAELARITRPGGTVSVTQRVDIEAELAGHAQHLVERSVWTLLERTDPASFHPERNDHVLQTVTTWRVV